MKLRDYRFVFVAVGLIGVLLISTPALASFIHPPGDDRFSELYLLGPNQKATNYPYNIGVGQNYTVYVGVGDELGSSVYYTLYVKFGNKTDQMPDVALGRPSSLPPLYEYRFSLQNGANWMSLLTFSVSNASIVGNNSQISTLQINGDTFKVDKTATRASNGTTFTYQLLFELWIYNVQTESVEFNNRYVDLQLNLTKTV